MVSPCSDSAEQSYARSAPVNKLVCFLLTCLLYRAPAKEAGWTGRKCCLVPVAVIKYYDKSELRKEGFIWESLFQGTVHCGGEAMAGGTSLS